jgi:hypothetical protein
MCTYPTYKQMNLLGPEHIFTDQPISIAIDIEDNPVCSPANNISILKHFLNVGRNTPVSIPDL